MQELCLLLFILHQVFFNLILILKINFPRLLKWDNDRLFSLSLEVNSNNLIYIPTHLYDLK